ncbi:TIGR02281 family clan AA aspartic protease [Iodobacter arcticus]|uniref:TIGR02281 family clan AA aspartic protease n=1 Tax=Iodobacter arcticus TaxID=590593 RepID=A0ABW2QZX0_9NEIS
MRSTLSIVLVWLLVAGGIYWGFNAFLAYQYNPNTRTSLSSGQGQQLILKRSRDGHFRLNGRINGQPVVLLIDTGATMMTLGAPLAERLQLKEGQPFMSQTANGVVQGYQSKLEQFSFGPFEFNQVTVGVVPQLGDEILLGMNVIKRFEVTLKDDQMILKMNH